MYTRVYITGNILCDDVIEAFQSDFKVVARFFKNRRLGKPVLADDTVLSYPAEIAELLAVLAGEKEYADMIPAIRKAEQKGEKVTMCWVAQELIDKGERRGENLLVTLMQKLFADGRTEDAQRAASNEQDRKQLYREYGLID